MSLVAKQHQFSLMVARLLIMADAMGYQVTLGEAWRTPEQAAIYAKAGKGIVHSRHIERIAIDLNLFRDGVLITDTEGHRPLGEWWETQGGIWGGRFKRPDGNHYEAPR